MRSHRLPLALAFVLCGPPVVLAAPPLGPIDRTATTKTYALELMIGPFEDMLMPGDLLPVPPPAGEVMVDGSMTEPKDPKNAKHVELHVHDAQTSAVIDDAIVDIAVTDSSNAVEHVPIAKMYDLTAGPSDMHFGNNFSMPAGSYTIRVSVNGETADFAVTVPMP
jgi:hypothetical protein